MFRIYAVLLMVLGLSGLGWAHHNFDGTTSYDDDDFMHDDREYADNASDYTLNPDYYPCSYKVTELKALGDREAPALKEQWVMPIRAYTKSLNDCAELGAMHCNTWINQSTPAFVIVFSENNESKTKKIVCK